MCQMSMKLPAMFDQNPPHTFDKIVKKLITTKKLSKLDLDPKCQGHIRNQKPMIWGYKKHATPKKFEQGCLRPKKINNMFLRHFFLENDAGGWLFIFDFFE